MVKFYENITQDTQNLVKELTGQMKSGKPCALTVYHPHCGHCMDMKPNWKAMGEHMEKKYNDDLYIAFIHMDVANEFPIDQYKIQGYPHIIYTANKNEVEYNGPREVNAFESWILENLKQTNSERETNKNGNSMSINVNTRAIPNSNSNVKHQSEMNYNVISNLTNNFNADKNTLNSNNRHNSNNSNNRHNRHNSNNSNNRHNRHNRHNSNNSNDSNNSNGTNDSRNVLSYPLNQAKNSLQLYRKLLEKHSKNKNSQITTKPKSVNKIKTKSAKSKKSFQKPRIKLTKKSKLSKKASIKSKKQSTKQSTKQSKKQSTKQSKKTKSSRKTSSSRKPSSAKKSNTRKLKTFHDLNTL